MDHDRKHFPALLADILQGIVPIRPNTAELHSEWRQYTDTLKTGLPGIEIKDDGDTVCLGALSPGCRCCKNGEWDCLFITPACNLHCRFCISPFQNRRVPVSAYGKSPEDLISSYKKAGITGVSFSGGEPFLDFPAVTKWLSDLESEFPDHYYWIYTNGTRTRREHIDTLSELGLDEIRFNTAATGYHDSAVMQLMAYAAQKLPNVTVEVPLLYHDYEILRTAIPDYARAGVQFLNLHELMRESHTPSHQLKNENFKTVVFPDGHVTDVSMHSRIMFQNIAHTVLDSNLPLNLNFCSTVNKRRQIRKRRSSIMKLNTKTYEKVVDEGCLESVFVFQDKDHYQWVHPDVWEARKSRFAGYTAFRLKKTAPLSVWDRGRYLSAEKLEDHHVVSSSSAGKM
ncbi:radical SAM protein [bacterium]|nr:radical SAM protein [bacterium]